MIPKTIHYCWFGPAKKSKKIVKCIDSWKKICPDYEIIEWNERNFDVNLNAYTRRCYKEKKYAFLSDYARLWILEKNGGIYLDTDVELIRSPSFLLEYDSFYAFENKEYVASGLGFGTVPHDTVVRKMLAEYDSLMNDDPKYIGCPILNTQALEKLGLVKNGHRQYVGGSFICPPDWFNPYDMKTESLNTTDDTVGIHWFDGSWLPWPKKVRKRIGRIIRKSRQIRK